VTERMTEDPQLSAPVAISFTLGIECRLREHLSARRELPPTVQSPAD
jgi:hypothetical protein